MPNRCIICVACGKWYPRGAARQRKSIQEHFLSDPLTIEHWVDRCPDGCPPYDRIPYAFKPYAFAAMRDRGFDSCLWMDASCYATGSLSRVFEQIESDGYLLFAGGHPVGEWTTDASLVSMGLSRDEAMHIPDLAACVMGLDFRSDVARRFLDQWMAYAVDGVTFVGSHTNERGQCSADPRVKGHRHDQTAASVIAHRLGMRLTHMPMHVAYLAYGVGPDTVIVNSGM